MSLFIGTDIIEINRIEKAVQNEKFIKRIYTKNEIEYCESKGLQKYQSYAGKFSAKDFEILNDKTGKPYVKFDINIEGLKDIEISISHCKEYAIAYVVAVF